MDDLFDKMRAYFQECRESLNGAVRKAQIASIDGLCLKLGIRTADFMAYESSEDEGQVDFFNETIMRYADLCNTYQALNMMTVQQRERLDKTLFNKATGDSKTGIVLVFPNWNAPDDWEDYVAIKEFCKDRGMTVKKLLDKLEAVGV